ncbi:hypothetical protein LWI29_035808 [Acer saccharum]|uniref:RNase H type-1 domain-containing protein n=1 Tax=Acer saccharum TaxID=4024 RepID=A0AA39W9J9_ACESA|nr:hypothetical protein LWI29_035808 [Acer saccharum]
MWTQLSPMVLGSVVLGQFSEMREVESDSLGVVNLCNEKTSSNGDVANIIADILEIASCYPVISISHVPRCCNKVAHATASWAFGSDISVFWRACPPYWLSILAFCDFVSVYPLEF